MLPKSKKKKPRAIYLTHIKTPRAYLASPSSFWTLSGLLAFSLPVTTCFSGQQRLSANITRPSSSLSKIKTWEEITKSTTLPGRTLYPTRQSSALGYPHHTCPSARRPGPKASDSALLYLFKLWPSLTHPPVPSLVSPSASRWTKSDKLMPRTFSWWL